MQHKPSLRLGTTVGLVLILVLALLDVGLAVLALTAPVTPLTVLRVALILLNLLVMGLVIHSLICLNHASYTLDRNRIEIRWGGHHEIIPMAQVERIVPGTTLGQVSRFKGLRWPGFWSGQGRVDNVGPVRFFCSTPLERQLVIQTAGLAYAISPENSDRFMSMFAAQRAMGPSEEIRASSTHSGPEDGNWTADTTARWLLGAAGGLNLALYILVTAVWNRLPAAIPLHFAPDGMVDRLGAPANLFILVGFGTAAWLLNGLLGSFLYRRPGERTAAYLLWGASVLVQLLLWGALLGLLRG